MAGLLDNLFNPSLYGGQNGGLLDFLRNTQMQQNNYQPSGGFAPVEQGPQPAQPIMVGGNQMPRIGDATRFDPSLMNAMAEMPSSQQTQGQMPQAASQSPSFFDNFGSMARPAGKHRHSDCWAWGAVVWHFDDNAEDESDAANDGL